MSTEEIKYTSDEFNTAPRNLDEQIGQSKNLRKMAPVRMISAGGFVAVTFLRNRGSTEDVDYILDPDIQNPKKAEEKLLIAIRKVTNSLDLTEKWINDSMTVFAAGERRRQLFRDSIQQNQRLFEGKYLIIYAAKWQWALAQKLKRLAVDPRDIDRDDAVELLKSALKRSDRRHQHVTVAIFGLALRPLLHLMSSAVSSTQAAHLNFQVGAMNRVQAQLKLPRSPLLLRSTVRRLWKCPQRAKLVRQLLWPFPWRFAPAVPPPDLVGIGPDKDIIAQLQPGIRQLQCIPLYEWRDTSLCSLYRMYEDICARDFVMLGYECEYFFYRTETRWRICNIADPEESDPVVYAILASLVEALTEAFNWKLGLGVRRNGRNDHSDDRARNFEPEVTPAWSAAVKAVDKTVDLMINHRGVPEGTPHKAFSQRNILAPMGYLYNI